MSQEYQYFYEDEIYRIKQNGQLELGMVLENAEFVSSDDESDLDDDDKVTKGNIRVAWYPNGEEKVLSERKVGLCDRSLMPGDVVRRLIRGKDTQRGYCRNVKVSASVQVVGTKFVIASVDSSSLTPLEDFAPDIAVALNSWVGMVNMVKLKIGLVLSDGSRCSMSYDEALLLDDLRDTREKDSEFRRYSFYPGQHLAGSLKLFEAAKWNSAKEKESLQAKCQKIVRATVDRVEVVQLGVRWQCRAFSEDSTLDKEQPKYIVQGEDLKRVKMLNVFEPCTLQLGDGNFYVLKESDLLIPYDQWTKLTSDSLLRDTSNPCPLRSRPNTKQNRKSGTRRNGKRTKSVSVSVERDSKLTKAVSPPLSDGDAEVEESDSLSVSGNEGSSGSQNLRRGKRTPALMTRVLKKRKLRRAKTSRSESAPPSILFKPGDRLVVETLMTTSRADVVWQDGSVEEDIPSTVLFPIHHLDDQEFFPGDLVVEQRNAVDSHEYGVVQSVDHAGRTAVVKWFHTYTAGNAPRPYLKTEQEVSVYDLRDHPDFRYRPGSVVIRVANFDKGQVCSTGQVLDNFPSGQVSVWWVDGSQSLCFPQDLYKVGEYDSDEGELWEDTSSDQSWETESEHSTIAEESETENECQLKTKLVANIEKARIAMSRLEEIFTQNPSLQTAAVIKQLWDCYKECRSIDKLMGTSFFHESNFQGLIERVREKGRASTSQKMAEQFNRLFSAYVDLDEAGDQSNCHEDEKEQDIQMFNDSLVNDDSNFALTNGIQNLDDEALCGDLETLSLSLQEFAPKEKQEKGPYALGPKQSSETALLSQDKDNDSSKRMKDSKSCNDIKSDGKATMGAGSSGTHALPLVDQRTSHMCAQLCSDMKAQLLKTYEEVVGRFGGHFDMSLMQAFQNAEKMIQEANEFLGSEGRKNGPDVASLATADDQPSNGVKHDSLEAVNVVAVAPTTTIQSDGFAVVSSAPDCHKFKLTMFEPTDPKRFYRTVRNEMNLLRTSLPTGIWVRGFEDRMDLYSVMIRGPERTPYEGGVFFFDFQLSADYPRAPPLCHYVSYCSEKLNPNLYEDGKVCVSLLGTWSGKGTEVWTSLSNLLQVIISIQGLILVSEPYFNEAGYERQKGTQQGRENSRMYNEMVVLKIIQAMTKVALNPPDVFKEEIFKHFHREAFSLVSRLKDWLRISEEHNAGPLNSPKTPTTFRQMALDSDTPIDLPEYPLIPASKGFCITLRKTLENFEHVLQSVGIVAASSNDVEPDSASAQAPLPSGSQVFKDVS